MTNGRGSNQYQTRGPSSATPRSSAATTAASVDDEFDVAAVAAAFSPEGLAPWTAWGATADEFAPWFQHGFSAGTAAWWTAWREGIDPTDALIIEDGARQGWMPDDGSQARMIRTGSLGWASSSVPTDQLGVWAATGESWERTKPWATDPNNEFSPAEAKSLIAAGWGSPAEYHLWKHHPDPAEARARAWLDVKDSGDLFARVFEPHDAVLLGLYDPEVYRQWHRAAFLPDEDEDLFEMRDAAIAARAGFTADEFAEWVNEVRPPDRFGHPDYRYLACIYSHWYATAAIQWRATFGDLGVSDKRKDVWVAQWDGVTDESDWMAERYDHAVARRWAQTLRFTFDGDQFSYERVAVTAWHTHGFDPTDAESPQWARAVNDAAEDRRGSTFVGNILIPIAGLLRRRGVAVNTHTPEVLVDLSRTVNGAT